MNKIYIALCLMMCAACNKETRPGPQAQIKLINSSVNTTNVQALFDEVQVVNNTNYPEASAYGFANVGMPTIKVQAVATNSNTYTVTGTSTLESNVNYTLVVADSANKMKISLVKDDFTTPAAGKASIRFFNLVGNATSSISLDTSLLTPAGGTLFTRSFNDQSSSSSAASFVTVNTGSYTLKIKTGTTVLATKNVNLESGKVYTLAATGTGGATTAPQAVGITVFPYN